MLNRDQRYAMKAQERVCAFWQENCPDKTSDQKACRQYGAMCHKLPILIRTAGLAQALTFVESRPKKDTAYQRFLSDLAATVEQPELAATARGEGNLLRYMRLTQQVLAALLWYKRFAQSILGVDASNVEEGEEA